MGVPDLSALAGARAGMIGVTLLTKKRKNKRQPLEIKGVEGRSAHLKLEKPRFLFLEGWRYLRRARWCLHR
jgi:hypothetical protein